jgi:radical SAM superfamily enzyme YgiQ (UPF0313 family)
MKQIKKIFLVVPNFRWRGLDDITYWHFVPYNLCLIAAMIDKRYDIQIIDANFKNFTEEEFKQIIKNESPDLVGITVLMDQYGTTGHTVARIVKEVNPQIITVIGGVYATTNEEYVMSDCNIDYLISGEGEYVFRDLIEYLQNQNHKIPKGVWYREGKCIINGGRADLIEDLDKLPLPAYHLIDFPAYSNLIERNSTDRPPVLPYAWLFTSRGCPFNCCFCQVRHIAGAKFRARSPENVLNELKWLKTTYHIKSFNIMDDNFLTDRKRTISFLKGLIDEKLDLQWKMINTALFYLDYELLNLMKRSGCQYIDIAIESGSPRVLKDIIHKSIKKEKVLEIIKWAKELGIFITGNFILGFPGETWDEIRQTLLFAEQIDLDYVKIFFAVPLPKTDLFKLAIELKCMDENFDTKTIDWKHAIIQTDQFSKKDISILRAYEWDRINFTNPEKRRKIAKVMEISEEELLSIRRRSLDSLII